MQEIIISKGFKLILDYFLFSVFQLNVQLFPAIKWQYFMSVDGVHNEFPAHNFRDMPYAECRNIQDVRHRYVEQIQTHMLALDISMVTCTIKVIH